MRFYLAILLTALSALSACERLDSPFGAEAHKSAEEAERPREIDFIVDAEGVFYATRGADGKIHNTQRVERIPLAELGTTFVYVDGRTPNLRGEQVRYVANLVGASAGDRRNATLRKPAFVKASEAAGLGGARAALSVQRRAANFSGGDEEVDAPDALRDGLAATRPTSPGKSRAANGQPRGIKIESVGGEGATNSLGFGNSETVGWKSITVYYADWCGVCKRAMRWMDTNDVSYRAVDVEASDRNRREMEDFCREKNRSADSLPTIRIGDDIMKGWNASRFKKMAKL